MEPFPFPDEDVPYLDREQMVEVGELYLADISVPAALYAEAPLDLAVGAIFARGEILRLS